MESNDHDHLATGDVSLLSETVLPSLGYIGLFVLFGCHIGRPEEASR